MNPGRPRASCTSCRLTQEAPQCPLQCDPGPKCVPGRAHSPAKEELLSGDQGTQLNRQSRKPRTQAQLPPTNGPQGQQTGLLCWGGTHNVPVHTVALPLPHPPAPACWLWCPQCPVPAWLQQPTYSQLSYHNFLPPDLRAEAYGELGGQEVYAGTAQGGQGS